MKEGFMQLVIYNPQTMVGNNLNLSPYQPWLVLDVVVVLGKIHDMPKHPENLLSKFDLDKKLSVENLVKKFYWKYNFITFNMKMLYVGDSLTLLRMMLQ